MQNHTTQADQLRAKELVSNLLEATLGQKKQATLNGLSFLSLVNPFAHRNILETNARHLIPESAAILTPEQREQAILHKLSVLADLNPTEHQKTVSTMELSVMHELALISTPEEKMRQLYEVHACYGPDVRGLNALARKVFPEASSRAAHGTPPIDSNIAALDAYHDMVTSPAKPPRP